MVRVGGSKNIKWDSEYYVREHRHRCIPYTISDQRHALVCIKHHKTLNQAFTEFQHSVLLETTTKFDEKCALC